MTGTRRIWLIADPHIGHVSDGRDGGDWLELVMHDRAEYIGPLAYAINLGDIAHRYQPEQFARYMEVRGRSGIGRWFDVVGNHDFHGTESGAYQQIIGSPKYWTLVDGNVAFFSFPAERGNAAGLLVPEVEDWLRQAIKAHTGANIILAAHQFPHDTVEYSVRPSRSLYPRDVVSRFLREMGIHLWLGGHIHFAPRTAACSVARNGTTFINVASPSHTYNKDACISFVLELTGGSRLAVARCRDHDRHRYLLDQQVTVELPHPVELASSGPVFTPVELDVPDRYSRIDDEEVTHF